MFGGLVNFGTTLLVTVILFVLGFLWYGPIFGKLWMKLSKISASDVAKAKKKGMSKPMILNFVGTFLMVYVLSGIISITGIVGSLQGAVLGFWIWLGFFACTTLLGGVLWENKPWGLFTLNGLYWLVNLMLASSLVVIWS